MCEVTHLRSKESSKYNWKSPPLSGGDIFVCGQVICLAQGLFHSCFIAFIKLIIACTCSFVKFVVSIDNTSFDVSFPKR